VAVISLFHLSGQPHYRLMEPKFRATWQAAEETAKAIAKQPRQQKV